MSSYLFLMSLWGNVGITLDKTQTFVGILATLIVLCLVRDRNNFIYKLVATIHLESDIRWRTDRLNESISKGPVLTDIFEDIKKRKVKIQELPAPYHDSLMEFWRQVEIQPNIFNQYAESRNTDYQEEYKKIEKKREGLYNARFSFIILLFVMLVDCWPLSKNISCLIFLYLLVFYIDFTLVLWYKYIKGRTEEKHVFFTKTKGLVYISVVMSLIVGIVLLGISHKVMAQLELLLTFVVILCTSLMVMLQYKVIGIENSNKYNNGWIAKHAV